MDCGRSDTPRCEVLIAGAGPAGAAAAIALAPGRSVVLLHKPRGGSARPGESLAPPGRWLLEKLGAFEGFLAQGHTACHGNRAIWGSSRPYETDFVRDLDGHGWHLDRTRFDPWLRDVAVSRGARLIRPLGGVRVTPTADGHRVTFATADGERTCVAAVLIDAGGRGARVARGLGASRRASDRLVCGWVAGACRPGGRGAGLSIVEATADGWWYTAPSPGDRRVVAFHTDADLPAARIARDPARLLAAAAATEEIAAVIAPPWFEASEPSGFTAAYSASLTPCAGTGWLAAGDAAMSFDPIAGQGLYSALFTGHAAGAAADRYLLGQPDALSDYAHMMRSAQRDYRDGLRYCYGLQQRWPDSPFWARRRATRPVP